MKHIYNIIGVALMAVAIMSCGGQQKQGTKFAPKERTSSLTDSEREAAINQKRAELNIDIIEQLNSHGVKFSILQPVAQGEDITPDIAQRIAVKMLEIASQNGISGLGSAPGFVLGCEIAQTGRAATGTAPQKMTVQYTLTFKVANTSTGDVYATATQDVTGVGNSFPEANQNAANNIKNSPELQKMLQTASARIIDWYNQNVQTLKNQISAAEGAGDYDLALALAEAVPQQATAAFNYASSKLPELLKNMQKKHAAESLAALRAAIAEANGSFSPKVAACLQMIPEGTSEANEAQKLYASYEKKLEEKAAAENKQKELEEQRAHEKELAAIEADKMKCKYEQMANAKAMEKAMRYDSDQKNKGFWAKLGDRVLGGIDFLGDKVSDSEWEE